MTSGDNDADRTFVSLIDAYSRRVCPAVLDQHKSTSISSPLGMWLLLAACATAASGAARSDLEEALGCSATNAAAHLGRFLDHPPPALHEALALWVGEADVTPAFSQWRTALPSQVESGRIPFQEAADAWVEDHTLGLIKHLPYEISPLTRLILASVVATKVSWVVPFDVVPARGQFRASSPWIDRVDDVLLGTGDHGLAMLASTEAAGTVAVHFALATEELVVISVAADPDVERHQVFEAAYDIARLYRNGRLMAAQCSLFDLPLGMGHSWTISERETLTKPGHRQQVVESTVLPAWTATNALDLRASDLFGVGPALDALLTLIGPHPDGDVLLAGQAATASYTATGFEAAALDFMVLETRGGRRREKGIERRATLLFDHPFVALALAGSTREGRQAQTGHTEMFGLPIFSAWVADPAEAREGQLATVDLVEAASLGSNAR
jgi:hypothetical protein